MQNWTWAGEPVDPGPCVVVDVDGVIADGWHRQGFLSGDDWDWKGFFNAADRDAPIEGSVELLAALGGSQTVVLLTARPHYLHRITLDWLAHHGFGWDLLIMRARSDGGLRSPEFKRRSLHELIEWGFEPTLALDDDQRNIDMFRSESIPALYIHSGYYE